MSKNLNPNLMGITMPKITNHRNKARQFKSVDRRQKVKIV